MNHWRWAIVAMVSACAVVGAEAQEHAPTFVLPVAEVQPAEVPQRFFAATVRARYEAAVAFEASGRLLTRAKEAGSVVKRGEVLAQLDTSDLQAALEAAQAQAEQAKAQWVLASSERRRTEALFARGFVGAQQLDRDKAGEEAAKRAWEAASAQVTSRRLMVAHATLKAPQDGVVVQWLVEPGQVVAAGQPAVRIALGAERELEVALPESLAAAPQKGVAESPDGRRFVLLWREQEGAVDPISRTLRARYRFAEGTPKERPPILGEVWRVSFTPEDSRSVTAWRVPAAALDERGDGARVWRLARDGTVTPVAVTVERYGQSDAVVQGPLALGERIVAGGTHRLVAGAKVEAR